MSVEDRLDRLERRLAVLETLVRELAPLARRTSDPPLPHPVIGPEHLAEVPPVAPAGPPPAADGAAAPGPAPDGGAAAAGGIGARAPRSRPRRLRIAGSEEWIGQRGLLAVGVVALILAMGYLLKLSFDRGWISPALRCLGGGGAGLLVAAIGWRLQRRYRVYGAALIGCGAAIVYLSVWAASRLYGLMPTSPATAALAGVSLALAAVAWRIDVEALGASAALGGFFAPIVLGGSAADAGPLLVYLAAMAAALGGVAASRAWRLATGLVALSYFGLAAFVGGDAPPAGLAVYAGVGGAAGLALGLATGWWETRLLAFGFGWALLAMAADRLDGAGLILAMGMLLAAPLWWHAWRLDRSARALGTGVAWLWTGGELLYFVVTPLLLAWVVRLQAPEFFDARPGLLPAVIAAPYLLAGYTGYRPAFAMVGAAAAGLAAWLAWPGLAATWALLGLGLAFAAADGPLGRRDGRIYAGVALIAALQHLYTADLVRRDPAEPAFVGPWALGLWGTIALGTALAAGLWRDGRRPRDDQLVRMALWSLAGALAFFGVTEELGRLFAGRSPAGAAPVFASGLAVTTWWLGAGIALVAVGTRRGVGVLRLLGFASAVASTCYLVLLDLRGRSPLEPAFVGWWSGAFWLACVALAATALRLSRQRPRPDGFPVAGATWVLTGALLLYGVTRELGRFFDRSAEGAGQLAAGLAISVWWLLFAAALVVAGFRLGHRQLRLAGIGVAFLACAKVVLSDLATLDALYRVASVFCLGLVFLALAWLYHRRARDAEG